MADLASNRALAAICSAAEPGLKHSGDGIGGISGLPVTWEQMKQEWEMDGIITRRETAYLKQVTEEFAEITAISRKLKQELWLPCQREAERLAEYSMALDGTYKNLEAAIEEPVDMVRLRAEAEKLARSAEEKKTAAEGIIRSAGAQRDLCIREKAALGRLVKNLKENLINEEMLSDMERNIQEWYAVWKEKKAQKTMCRSDFRVMRRMQENIRTVGFEYKRRRELEEYVGTAERKISEIVEFLDGLCRKCGLLIGIWQALSMDMAEIIRILEKDLCKAENYIRELDSDYTKELWRRASETVMLFMK